jgi:hypothetical protein
MNTLDVVAPFVVAALAGAALAFFELLTTFQRNIGRALKSRWGLVLLGLNALSAVGVYAIVRYVFKFDAGIWTALVVGVTFPVVIRSRFTFYRQPGEKETADLTEFSLKVDEFYQTLQGWCLNEVNTLLAEQRKALAEAIKNKFSVKQLEKELRDLIASGVMPEKRQEQEKKLDEILQTQDNARREQLLALLLIDLSTAESLRHLTP